MLGQRLVKQSCVLTFCPCGATHDESAEPEHFLSISPRHPVTHRGFIIGADRVFVVPFVRFLADVLDGLDKDMPTPFLENENA